MSDLVAIAVRLVSWEAEILRGALEANGIFAAVAGATDFSVSAGTNCQVLVREEDMERALEIKNEALKP